MFARVGLRSRIRVACSYDENIGWLLLFVSGMLHFVVQTTNGQHTKIYEELALKGGVNCEGRG
jgi:hypothetical protein